MPREYIELSYEGANFPIAQQANAIENKTARKVIRRLLTGRLNRKTDDNAGQNLEDIEALQQVLNIINEELKE